MKKLKSNQKGFSLIELLVVVAIIGVLASVGVVAYQGFIASSKTNAAKANHTNIVKYVAAEFAKCASGSTTYLQYTNNTSGGKSNVTCTSSHTTHDNYWYNHFWYEGFKNPYLSTERAVYLTSSTNPTDGRTYIYCYGSNVCRFITDTGGNQNLTATVTKE